MGKQSKLKRVRRIRKEIEQIIEEGLETGKIIESDDENLQFQDEELFEQFFKLILSEPVIFDEFMDENPQVMSKIFEYLRQGDRISLEI